MAKHIEGALRTLLAQLSGQYRWRGLDYPPRETIAEHVFKQNFITLTMLRIEQDAGNPHGLDLFEILACCITHDFGEAIAGDTPVTQKTDVHERREAIVYEEIIKNLVPQTLRNLFPQPLDRNADATDINRQFWSACEQVGYVVYSSYQVAREPAHKTCTDIHLPTLRTSQFLSVHRMLDLIGLGEDP